MSLNANNDACAKRATTKSPVRENRTPGSVRGKLGDQRPTSNNVRGISILVLCFFLTGCDALYRILDKEGAEEKKLIGEVIPFEKNPTVEEIQTLLKLYGYGLGEVDGALGLRTRDAIARFQRDNGLKETRFADQETWKKLNVFILNKLVVDHDINVRLIQTILTEGGINPGKIDGKLGPKTIKAIKIFQKKFGLKVDGKIGYKTLTKLTELYEENTSP